MTSLFPLLADELRDAADERDRTLTAVRPRRAGRRRLRVAILAMAGVFAVSTGAYAARGLWQPILGTGDDRPVAVTGPASAQVMGALGVLRRPQNDADRGVASEAALRTPASARTEIRTGLVRRLLPAADAPPVILVPMRRPDGTERLCLWVGDSSGNPGAGGGRGCATPDGLERGRLVLGTGRPTSTSAQAQLELAAARRALAADRALGRATSDSEARLAAVIEAQGAPSLLVVGVVPDGVRSVLVGDARIRGDVADNAFAVTVPESSAGTLQVVMLGADGKPVQGSPSAGTTTAPAPPLLRDARNRRLLRYTLMTVSPIFVHGISPFRRQIADVCTDVQADPPLTQRDRVERTIARFHVAGRADLHPLTAANLLEVVTRYRCPRR